MKMGDKGKAVAELQRDLQKMGFYIGRVDGDFGPQTESAVEDAQHQFYVTGEADEAFCWRLNAEAEKFGKLPVPPHGLEEIEKFYGKFSWKDDPERDGYVIITDDWERQNMVLAKNVPVVGRIYCHKRIELLLREVMEDIASDARASEGFVEMGCFCPRHKMHDRKKPLSAHSWGMAVDWNPNRNRVNASKPELTPDHPVVKCFKKYGFEWGGDWKSVKDWMHFQFATGY